MRANGTLQHKDLVREINVLKGQLKKLSAALEHQAHEGVDRAVGAIETRSEQAIDGAIEATQDFIDEYADSAADMAERLAQKTAPAREAAAESLVEAVEARPFGTLDRRSLPVRRDEAPCGRDGCPRRAASTRLPLGRVPCRCSSGPMPRFITKSTAPAFRSCFTRRAA